VPIGMYIFPVLTLLLPMQSASVPQPPTQACLEILADSEGELELARDPRWRRKAVGKQAKMREEHDRYRASINRALARTRKRATSFSGSLTDT
jgi:hypothetical protein